MSRQPCQLSGEQMPPLRSGWEDVCTLVLGPTRWSGRQGANGLLAVIWDHLWALKPGLALIKGRRALSMLPWGIYHQVQAAAGAWLLIISKNPLVLQSLTLPPLGGQFTGRKVPAHAGIMLRCNNGRAARFGNGGSPPGPGEHSFSQLPGFLCGTSQQSPPLLSGCEAAALAACLGCSTGRAGPQVGAGRWACL